MVVVVVTAKIVARISELLSHCLLFLDIANLICERAAHFCCVACLPHCFAQLLRYYRNNAGHCNSKGNTAIVKGLTHFVISTVTAINTCYDYNSSSTRFRETNDSNHRNLNCRRLVILMALVLVAVTIAVTANSSSHRHSRLRENNDCKDHKKREHDNETNCKTTAMLTTFILTIAKEAYHIINNQRHHNHANKYNSNDERDDNNG